MRNLKKEIDTKILGEFFTGKRACTWHAPIKDYWNKVDYWFDYEIRHGFHRDLTDKIREFLWHHDVFDKQIQKEWYTQQPVYTRIRYKIKGVIYEFLYVFIKN